MLVKSLSSPSIHSDNSQPSQQVSHYSNNHHHHSKNKLFSRNSRILYYICLFFGSVMVVKIANKSQFIEQLYNFIKMILSRLIKLIYTVFLKKALPNFIN
jgi:hypothetical protein